MKKLFNDKASFALRKFVSENNVFCFCFLLMFSSCTNLKQYGKYQKRWAYAHPLAAIKLKKAKRECDIIYNAVKDANSLDKYENGGKLDAFRHMFYMAVFSSRVSSTKVRKLGRAHEKDNYRTFLNGKNEDGEQPDSISGVMDLINNDIGIAIGKTFNKKSSVVEIRSKCMQEIENGTAFFMKRDLQGNYLKCNNEVINLSEYRKKWNVPKCLVRN